MFHFNCVTRVGRFHHNVTGVPGLDYCYDCAAEVDVLGEYLTKCKRISQAESASEVARMSLRWVNGAWRSDLILYTSTGSLSNLPSRHFLKLFLSVFGPYLIASTTFWACGHWPIPTWTLANAGRKSAGGRWAILMRARGRVLSAEDPRSISFLRLPVSLLESVYRRPPSVHARAAARDRATRGMIKTDAIQPCYRFFFLLGFTRF